MNAPYSLRSLWDMLRNYFPFYKISGELHGLLGRAALHKSDEYKTPDKVWKHEAEQYENLLVAIQKACEEHGLSHTAEMAKRAAERKAATYDDVHHQLIHLNDSLTSELQREAIVRIPPERTGYYEQGDLFGPEVAAAFPSCARDIRNAGSCYALEQEDACVHHLMLVLERGLNALAGKVGAPSQRNWQAIIDQIALRLKSLTKGAERDFYIEVNSQFGFLKNAYRNHSEHAHDDPYDMAKALSILNHVRAFMRELEKGGLSE
jgi:hypothetical protein